MQTTPALTHTHACTHQRLTREEVMTPREVAEMLGIPVSTVYYLARQGQLPHSRVGRTYRFLRPRLEALLEGTER
jgi:excisionase family DNA binding protein